MEQSLPPSDSSTRPGTPQLTNCERMKAVTYDLRQSAVLIELQETTISTLRIQGLNDGRHDHPTEKINGFTSQASNSGNKSVQEYPPLPKTTAVERKEKEDGFSSPPTRKLSKNKRTSSNPDLNFKINLSNTFNGLENLEPTIEPAAGTLTDKTAINLPSNKNSRRYLHQKITPPSSIKDITEFQRPNENVNRPHAPIKKQDDGRIF
ncbi:hypothetical protein TNCV_4498731 [Trichonephila clavipes]|nr:hypothetical protein TNCV_4498731 [Trichonephila clavipes]